MRTTALFVLVQKRHPSDILQGAPKSGVWIGAYRANSTSSYGWVDGAQSFYTNWGTPPDSIAPGTISTFVLFR